MLFILAKVLEFLFNPLNILLLLALLALFLRIISHKRIAAGFAWAALALLIVISTVPMGEWALRILENRFPPSDTLPENINGVIVLGGSSDLRISEARGQPSLNRHAERLVSFVELGRLYPHAIMLFSGGSGYIETMQVREADVAEEIFRSLGMDTARIYFDPRPRNTFENASFASEILAPGPDDRWLLITSAAHMPRAVGCFRKQGFHVVPYPVDYQTKPEFRLYLRIDMAAGMSEVFRAARAWSALVYYWLADRIESIFPKPLPSPPV